MENKAFKDFVNSNSSSNGGNLSTMAIARKAVQEEFQKKKKRKHGGDGDDSSSDEDHNCRSSFNRKSKRQNQHNEEVENDGDNAIQNNLSSRYRDRAKERREGKSAKGTSRGGASIDFFIVPHNKKGLDLALLRKERSKIQTETVHNSE